jgi:toxin ParE1/3/4
MRFKVLFEPNAKLDIQDAISWYNHRSKGLGKNFYTFLRAEIERLRQNPYYQINYDKVRCLPLRKFPFMIHFSIDEANTVVIIHAVFNTSLDPGKWKDRV